VNAISLTVGSVYVNILQVMIKVYE